MIEERPKTAMMALENGAKWIPTATSEVRGYHINSLYSPLGMYSWKQLVQAFLDADKDMKAGDVKAMKAWQTMRLAIPWEGGAALGDDSAQIFKALEDERLPVSVAFIDSGGHRTKEIYQFCYENPIFKPTKGASNPQAPLRYGKIDRYPNTNIPIAGGITLITIATNYYKDALNAKLRVTAGDTGAFMLHSDMPIEYAKQMTAEYINDHGNWENRKGRDNHYWDCETGALAAADFLGLTYYDPEAEAAQEEEAQAPKKSTGWINGSRGAKRRRW